MTQTHTTLPRRRPQRLFVAASLALLALPAAQAQTAPDNQWHGGIALGGAAASGNTSSQMLTGTADAAKESSLDKISLYGLTNYAKSKLNGVSTTTANRLAVGGRYDHNLSAQLFAFGGADAETNKAGGLDSRYGINGGLGYKLVRTPVTTFDVFGGIGYASNKFTDGSSSDGAELLLGEESTHKLGESSTFKQRLVLRPGQGDLGNLVTFDAGLATAISGGWTLNTGLSVRYASKPAVGLKSTDTLVTVGFGYKF